VTHALVRTFHATAVVVDYDATVAALARVVGLRVLEYGEDDVVGRRGGMTWIGDGSLEVAEPIVAGHPVERFLQRFGPGLHSHAFQVEDLDATIEHLAAHGVAVAVRPGDGFCFTDPRTTGGLLFEWSDFTVPEDPRVGAPVPPFTVAPLLDVETVAFVGAVVADPLAWAETFGPVLGLHEAFRDVAAGPGRPTVGLAAPDGVIALYRLPGAESRALWGVEHERARWHVLGVGVRDLSVASTALHDAGVRLVRGDEAEVVVEPAATGDVPIMVVEISAARASTA
jgi:hypothetical protein